MSLQTQILIGNIETQRRPTAGGIPAENHGGLTTAVIMDDSRQEAVKALLKQEVGLCGGVASDDGLQLDRPDLISKAEEAIRWHIQPTTQVLEVWNGC